MFGEKAGRSSHSASQDGEKKSGTRGERKTSAKEAREWRKGTVAVSFSPQSCKGGAELINLLDVAEKGAEKTSFERREVGRADRRASTTAHGGLPKTGGGVLLMGEGESLRGKAFRV